MPAHLPERTFRSLTGALALLLLTRCAAPTEAPAPTTVRQALACSGGGSIDQHAAQCDGTGKLLSWAPPTNPGSSAAYDYVLDLNQNYLLALPNLSNLTNPSVPKPAYYAHSYLCSGTAPGCSPAGQPVGWPHNPAGLNAMLIESGLAYSPYKNDPRLRDVALALLDWHLLAGGPRAHRRRLLAPHQRHRLLQGAAGPDDAARDLVRQRRLPGQQHVRLRRQLSQRPTPNGPSRGAR